MKRKKTEKRVTYEVEAEFPSGWRKAYELESLPLARELIDRNWGHPLRIIKVTREVVR